MSHGSVRGRVAKVNAASLVSSNSDNNSVHSSQQNGSKASSILSSATTTPTPSVDMSAFRDFQTAWRERFPGCELPKAWEEDVRSNLSKHRQQVTSLKEELEKEEFYVEYLERLLADVVVERVRGSSRSNSISTTAANLLKSQSPTLDHHSSSSRADTPSSKSDQNGDQYVTVITVSSYGEIQKSNSTAGSANTINSSSNSLVANAAPAPTPTIITSSAVVSSPRTGGDDKENLLIENPLYQDVVQTSNDRNWVSCIIPGIHHSALLLIAPLSFFPREREDCFPFMCCAASPNSFSLSPCQIKATFSPT